MTAPAAAAIAQRVDLCLDELLSREEHRWRDVDADLEAPLAALRSYVLGGGKRLRPAFCYWAFIGAGGDGSDPAVVAAGAALELLHAAALIHDDVIDGAATRHGGDALHVQLAGEHGRRFGESAAILVGDLAVAYSSTLLSGAPAAATAVFDEMRVAVNVGQYLDVFAATARHDLGGPEAAERARRICLYKTAKYTVEGPLHLGAAMAAPERFAELRGPLSDFALPLGEAFQLRDDLLGVFGDPAATGKPVGDDLREGKFTLLVTLAASRAAEPDRRRLEQRLGAADLRAEEVAVLQDIIVASGAKDEVEATIVRLHREATAALSGLRLPPEAHAALQDLAAFATGRDH